MQRSPLSWAALPGGRFRYTVLTGGELSGKRKEKRQLAQKDLSLVGSNWTLASARLLG